jgi:putative protease
MMVTAQCIHQGVEQCDKVQGLLMMKDRMGKEFPVRNHCTFCYNSIYNSTPVSLHGLQDGIKALAPSSLRLQFTIEDKEQTTDVITYFSEEFYEGQKMKLPFDEFTRGHFKRGVE